MGVTETLVGLTFTIGPLGLGYLWENVSINTPFYFGGALMLLAAGYVLVSRLRTGPQ